MTTTSTGSRGHRGRLHSRTVLLLAFAFAVMADPVSSVAYAVEAALRALEGDLSLLLATMSAPMGMNAHPSPNASPVAAEAPPPRG